MHENLGLGAGDVACDDGSGNGNHTLPMAQAVGPRPSPVPSEQVSTTAEQNWRRAIRRKQRSGSSPTLRNGLAAR